MRRPIAACLDGLLLFWVLAVGPICWILRDGLGPGAGDSTGIHALLRFSMTFYWGPTLLMLGIMRFLARARIWEEEPEFSHSN